MAAELFWIDGPWRGKLAIALRPRGGEWLADEIRGWREAGVDAVASLLTGEEAIDLGLEEEQELCEAAGIEFRSLPIVDRGVPTSHAEAVAFLHRLDGALKGGANVAVHCRQGIGRSGLIAAGLLVESGMTPEAAVRRISDSRGIAIPETEEQRVWIDRLAATLAGRN
jgi:protein-tyrosine phosphatase